MSVTKQISNSFDFSKILACKELGIYKKTLQSILAFSAELKYQFGLIEENLPYHFNIIDELRANENAHSRILHKILDFKKKDKFPVLKSFLEFLEKKEPRFSLSNQISSPFITSEKFRIDNLIRDNSYAIIIENKFHYAADQPGQLERYVDIVRKLNYIDENIFIIFLTRDGQSPSEQSFSKKEKEKFKGRYLELAYRQDILNWLKEVISMEMHTEMETFRSALTQYLDHLNGLFELRQNQKAMNKELENFVEKKLGLSSDNQDFTSDAEKLQEKLNELNKTLEVLNKITKKRAIQHWKVNLKEDFDPAGQNLNLDFRYANIERYPKMGIILKYRKWEFLIFVGLEGNRPYYGIRSDFNTNQTSGEVIEFLKNELDDLPEKNKAWYGYKYVDYPETYTAFKDLARGILQKPGIEI